MAHPAKRQAARVEPSVLASWSEARRTADVLVDQLVRGGVEVVFGLPGGAISPLHDALMDHPEVRVITTRHESGSMFAAAGYARATGKLGVVLVTSGPGVLNAFTGLASAHCDGLPLLLLAGEVPRALFGRKALQEGSAYHLDVVGMTRHISKLSMEIPRADMGPTILDRAIHVALTPRYGPVVITLPLDINSALIRTPWISPATERVDEPGPMPIQPAVSHVAHALHGAARPVIFAGSGARWGKGPERLRQLAERLQAPVMTTPKAKGVFPESHPLSLGVFGHGGHPSTSKYLQAGIDTLLAVGTGLSDPATDGWSQLLAPKRHFIQIDADALQVGRNYPVTHALIGEAERLLDQILAQVPYQQRVERRFELSYYTDSSQARTGPEGLITPQHALWELQHALPPDSIFTCDIGEHLLFATHYLRVDQHDGFVIMTGLASMASSIGAAVGSKLAYPTRPVVAVCGDGCYAMGFGDVATAAREEIPIIVVVLNDGRYGMVEIGHEAVYGRKPDYPAGPMSVAEMASSVGAESVVVDQCGVIEGLDLVDPGRRVPLVLDIRIDRAVKMPKNKRNESLRHSLGQPMREKA